MNMTHHNINYQQIFEEELNDTTKESADFTARFYELSNEKRMLAEELIDAAYKRALEDLLDPEVISDTVSLAGEMGTQLYNFANMLQAYLAQQEESELPDL
jgi:hypothetical protein